MYDRYLKGQIAVLKVQTRAAEKGFTVSVPTTESRYDLLVDDGKRIWRAQVKYAGREQQSTSGSVELDLRKETRNNGKKRTYSKSEIDVVLVYVPQIDEVLWLGSDIFDGVKSLTFRFEKPKNNQASRLRMAKDFVW